MLTIVYAPINRTLKIAFWNELRYSRLNRTDKWMICGDFNAIRARHENQALILMID